jgi:hypothetical protein
MHMAQLWKWDMAKSTTNRAEQDYNATFVSLDPFSTYTAGVGIVDCSLLS